MLRCVVAVPTVITRGDPDYAKDGICSSASIVVPLKLCVGCRTGLPARARRKASSEKAAAEAVSGAEASCELYPVPCNLGVVAMDESTIELNFSADGDEHGVRSAHDLPNPTPN